MCSYAGSGATEDRIIYEVDLLQNDVRVHFYYCGAVRIYSFAVGIGRLLPEFVF